MQDPRNAAGVVDISPLWFFRMGVLTLLLGALVDATFLQAQELSLGRIVFSMAFFKVVLALALVGYGLFTPPAGPKLLWLSWQVLCIYLLLDALNVWFIGNISLIPVITGYWLYYPPIILIPIAIGSGLNLPEERVKKILLAVFVIVGGLAVVQYLTNSPILPVTSSDGTLRIGDAMLDNHVRAFSLFTYPGLLANFAAFIGAIAIASMRRRLFSNLKWWAWFIFAGAVCYMTLLRAGWLGFVWIAFTAWFLRATKRTNFDRVLPLGSLFVAFAIIIRNLTGSLTSGGGGATDAKSFLIRLQEWQIQWNTISAGNTWKLLFGFGIVQSLKPGEGVTTIAIDNIFLQLLLHVGIVGTILFLIYFALIWLYLLERARRTRSPLSIATAGIWSALPLIGMFSLPASNLALYCLVLMICAAGDQFGVQNTLNVPPAVAGSIGTRRQIAGT